MMGEKATGVFPLLWCHKRLHKKNSFSFISGGGASWLRSTPASNRLSEGCKKNLLHIFCHIWLDSFSENDQQVSCCPEILEVLKEFEIHSDCDRNQTQENKNGWLFCAARPRDQHFPSNKRVFVLQFEPLCHFRKQGQCFCFVFCWKSSNLSSCLSVYPSWCEENSFLPTYFLSCLVKLLLLVSGCSCVLSQQFISD